MNRAADPGIPARSEVAGCSSLPIAHRRAIRTTNLLERLFGEERRRTKVIPHGFGERPVLKLMYSALIRASQSWQRIRITEFELKQIDEIRSELDNGFSQRTASAVHPASRQRIESEEAKAAGTVVEPDRLRVVDSPAPVVKS
jgi:hypothetical protein